MSNLLFNHCYNILHLVAMFRRQIINFSRNTFLCKKHQTIYKISLIHNGTSCFQITYTQFINTRTFCQNSALGKIRCNIIHFSRSGRIENSNTNTTNMVVHKILKRQQILANLAHTVRMQRL